MINKEEFLKTCNLTEDYTELLFSAGRISMESLEMLVKMTKEEQGRFFTEFRSLLMDE